ncbi:RluA family pseudouridine synthase [Butyricicoccus intestinisimiae]|uniref:Pseudouridine synthase n=1 Tax=Butyricicoccus intestinisimiae TaxID=2841509 RepID=A0ABS6ETY8_9FIRM|nr:RluA family pseudouridine synthase [Butyricicoccus intestinisimiae]MBU5491138.1 RluA family pseudouridine synthase [Butyricicoccus intestinisimiae]
MIRNNIQYQIPPEFDGCTADRFLRAQGFSRHLLIQTKYQENGLLLDGISIRSNQKLHAGQILRAAIPHIEPNENLVPVDLPFSIVYEDSDLIVLNKPAGMPVHPSHGHYDDTLSNALAYYYRQRGESFTARSVGRLDRDTSGLVLFSLHELSACILAEQMRNREIHREYRAICTGTLPEAGCIRAPIARAHDSTIERIVDDVRGEPAVTHFERLAVCNGFSLAAVRLETGRTHQIRVHMKHIGHPLPGDFLYHPDYSRIARQALHSYKLSFLHPITKQPMVFTAPIPEDMQALLSDDAHTG